jgi:hypothetical protein
MEQYVLHRQRLATQEQSLHGLSADENSDLHGDNINLHDAPSPPLPLSSLDAKEELRLR